MKHLKLALVLTLAGLSGCGAQTYWDRPGATAWEFDAEKAHCDLLVAEVMPETMPHGLADAISTGIGNGLRHAELEGYCLQENGWVRVPRPRT